MSETISLEWIGRTLLAIQAEMRTIRDENVLIRTELGRTARRDEVLGMARREEVLDILRVLADRIAGFETTLLSRLDQTERSINERLELIERSIRKP